MKFVFANSAEKMKKYIGMFST